MESGIASEMMGRDGAFRGDGNDEELDVALAELAMEVEDGGDWVGQHAGVLASFGEVRGAEERRAGEVFQIGSVKEPVILGEDGLLRARAEVCGEEGLDDGTDVGVEVRRRFDLFLECLEVFCGGKVDFRKSCGRRCSPCDGGFGLVRS